MTIIKVDLDVDANYDSDPEGEEDEILEESPGGLIRTTEDVDSPNRTMIVLQQVQPSGWSGDVFLSLSTSVSNVFVFPSMVGGQAIAFDGVSNRFSNADLSPQKLLWVEARTPSTTIEDIELALEVDGVSGCSDAITLTSIDVDYAKSSAQEYGYDDLSNPGYPYKSVKKGDTDVLLAQVSPMGAASRVFFDSSNTNVSVSPTAATTSPQTLTVQGNAKGDGSIQAWLGTNDYSLAATMTACSYEAIAKKVALYLVTDGLYGRAPTNTVTASELEDYLNDEVYNQVAATFTVVHQGDVSSDYDLDADGSLDNTNDEHTVVMVDYPLPATYDYSVFIVDDISHEGDYAAGFAQKNNWYSFVNDAGNNHAISVNVIAHELGHAFGNLDDQDIEHPPPSDPRGGLMGIGTNPAPSWFLYHDEWETIHDLHNP